jgi:hypothetical protein
MKTKIVTKAIMHSGYVGKEIQKSSLKFADCFSPQKTRICKHNIQRGKKIVGLYAQ